MSQSLEEIYTAEWFAHDFGPLQPEFNVAADAIVRQFTPDAVTDVGCGPGMLLTRLKSHGVVVLGIEGSSHGIDYAEPDIKRFITHADVTKLKGLQQHHGHRHVVVCTEVAEHLDEQHAAGLVELLCSAMAPIVFTAAPPGQDGLHHVNLKDEWWWTELFRSHGVIKDEAATLELKRRWGSLERLSHMTRNVVVYT